MRRIFIGSLIALGTAFTPAAANGQERLNVGFRNGDFERTTSIIGVDGTRRTGPASTVFFSGFTHGGGYGDELAILETDPNEARPGSSGTSSVHIMHPELFLEARYQTHLGQTARGSQELTGLTFDVELWIRTENWWDSINHYVQAWVMPVDAAGVTLGDTHALDPLAILVGPHPDDPTDQILNRIAGTTEWTLYRLENIEIVDPDTFGFYIQVSAWFNNTGKAGEVAGEAHAWVDDMKLVVPSGSDQTDVPGWMLY